ncbi:MULTISPECIES: hypothetical protein [Burkholderia]|nr:MULTISPECIES: hypothetical protein [Burkholderia]MCU9951823.1 hypothetical protein [Burkholderia sp. BKH01]
MGKRLFHALKMQDAAVRRDAPGGAGHDVAAIVVFIDSKNLLFEF